MQQRGTPVQRWQKPFSNLLEEKRSITLLRVNSQTDVPVIAQMEQDWVKKGNTLVILGVQGRVTEAAFSTMKKVPLEVSRLTHVGGRACLDVNIRRNNWAIASVMLCGKNS